MEVDMAAMLVVAEAVAAAEEMAVVVAVDVGEVAIKMNTNLLIVTATLAEKTQPVFPFSFSLLGKREQQFFEDLANYQAPWLCERLIKKGEVKNEEECNLLFIEFKKYVALLTISQQSLGMVSTKVDNVWHEFILFTREYMKFCDQFYGKYIHHQPYTSSNKGDPEADVRFHRWYHKVYGTLPAIWK
ncbi:hypothetical protein HYV86_01325 [Candidatus Woesearchaeota archaeon]|nr:hypothetical protein [Candidatus Woesearchaeota archaeon]